jgi:hypothetical protein
MGFLGKVAQGAASWGGSGPILAAAVEAFAAFQQSQPQNHAQAFPFLLSFWLVTCWLVLG